MASSQNRIVNVNLMGSSPLPLRTVAMSNRFNRTIIEQEPIFFLELSFSFKFKKWLRNFNGDWTLIQTYPIAPSSSYLFKIKPCCLFAQSPTSYNHFIYHFLDGFLSDLNFNAPLRSSLANEISSILVSLANEQSFSGFCAVIEVETANQEFLDAEEILNLITATDYAMGGGDLVVPPSRGTSTSAIRRLREKGKFNDGGNFSSDEISGDCPICLDELSDAVKVMIKLPCNHVFHEQCIFKWLENRNSCPICRSEI